MSSPTPTSGFRAGAYQTTCGRAFALWLSPHILDNTVRVLATVIGTPKEEAQDYRDILVEMAEASGGGC